MGRADCSAGQPKGGRCAGRPEYCGSGICPHPPYSPKSTWNQTEKKVTFEDDLLTFAWYSSYFKKLTPKLFQSVVWTGYLQLVLLSAWGVIRVWLTYSSGNNNKYLPTTTDLNSERHIYQYYQLVNL